MTINTNKAATIRSFLSSSFLTLILTMTVVLVRPAVTNQLMAMAMTVPRRRTISVATASSCCCCYRNSMRAVMAVRMPSSSSSPHHRTSTTTTTSLGYGKRPFTTGIGRSFLFSPEMAEKPKLILVSGCTGTGKSTFGMSVALDQGILKAISTDTVRAVMRSFISPHISPALHRSSYTVASEGDDPVRSWLECCTVLQASVEGLVDDAIRRGVSLVVEGVHVVPDRALIDKWEKESGGHAVGCLLTIEDPDAHKSLLRRRGYITGKNDAEEKKIKAFDRIRVIQEEMIRRAVESDWLLIEQKLEQDPLERISARLWRDDNDGDDGGRVGADDLSSSSSSNAVFKITEARAEEEAHDDDPDDNDNIK